MTSYVIFFVYDVTKSLKMRKWRHISSYVHFIKKCPVTTFFSIKFPIEWAIWELYDNFEIFRKKIFQWGRIFKNRGAVSEISTDFQSESGFKLKKKIGESSFEESTELQPPLFPIMSLPYLLT